jgi:protein-S-isoprenylcysteine O-methyltransferase Ste14
LAFVWTAWCAVHSVLISIRVIEHLRHHLGGAFHYYRIFYNGVSVITLIPVALYTYSLQTEPLFSWEGPLRAIQLLLLFISFLLFISGIRHYDVLQFLGIRQIRQSNSCMTLTENCELDTAGILGVIRHPWYLGGMILVWPRNLDISAILTNTIITGYFVIGAFLEERKLKIQFGKTYTDYQRRVSMFFPYKWLKATIRL